MQLGEEYRSASGADENHYAAPDPQTVARKKRLRRNWIIFILLGVLAFVVGRMIQSRHASAKKASESRAGQLVVPVVGGTVAQKDVPIYLDGLGTTQALNTVTVRARVDGEIKKVAFVEGQDVHKGDLLAQIDDAPFKAQFEQAIAKKAQDEAQLAN